MSVIKVSSVSATGGKLRISFEVSAEIERYFTAERVHEIEYSEDISTVPESVLVIPFVCNVLPIAWLADASLEISQLDKEFYEGIPGLLEGYKNMSPMLEFKGNVKVGQLVDNSYTPSDKVGALFSGGVDAFATLIAHAEENPRLVTLWGADVKLTDTEGWDRVKQHAEDTCKEFDLLAPLLVRSNFRLLVNEGTLGELVAASGDGWWHGYQHGIALLGHSAPVAYLERWKTLYIASSFTPDNKAICASDPTIDNMLHLVSTRVWHDQYECHRQQKVGHIVAHCRATGKAATLRVCWITSGGTNCCVCEKCQRTIFALLAEGENPANYGFKDWKTGIEGTRYTTPKHCRYTPRRRIVYAQIQTRFLETGAYKDDPAINWFYQVDFYQAPTIGDKWRELCSRVRQILEKKKRKLRRFISKYICSPRLAECVRRWYKKERSPWMLTQEEVDKASCFVGLPKKPLSTIRNELRQLCTGGNGSWTIEATINHYFMLGLDRRDSDVSNFVFQERYDRLRNKKQPKFAAMLKHKYYTASYLNSQGINISLPLGEINADGQIFNGGEWKPLKQVLEKDNRVHYFCKQKDGCQGRGHVIIDYLNGKFFKDGKAQPDGEIYKELNNHTIEPRIIQHPALNKIYEHAVSNVRLITLSHEGEIFLYAQAILVGSRGERVSNLGFGGIVIGLDPNGVMKDIGIYTSSVGYGAINQHPDSGIIFEGFQIPMWREAVELALRGHAALRDIHSIGWDIAITPQGPIIIEANDEWGTMTQCLGGYHHKNLIRKYFELEE